MTTTVSFPPAAQPAAWPIGAPLVRLDSEPFPEAVITGAVRARTGVRVTYRVTANGEVGTTGMLDPDSTGWMRDYSREANSPKPATPAVPPAADIDEATGLDRNRILSVTCKGPIGWVFKLEAGWRSTPIGVTGQSASGDPLCFPFANIIRLASL